MPASGLPPLPPELDPRGRRRARASGATAALSSGRIVLRLLAALVSASLVVYIGFLWSKVHNIDNGVPRVDIAAIDDPTTANGQTAPDIDGKDENILIVGNDDRTGMTNAEVRKLKTGRDGGSTNTDTMMIVHVPADGAKATLISLPRDSYVSIPGYGMNRLNTAYSDGYNNASGSHDAKIAAGANLLIKTIYNLTGLRMDHFVQVGLLGFYRIAQAIGPIPVNLCESVDDTHQHNVSIGQDGGSGFKMSKGPHELNAVQSLEFVRQRHNLNGGDLDRVMRQRYFLTAAFRKIASAGILLNPSKLGDLISAVDKSLFLDKGLKILELAKQMSNLSANNIVGKTIPIAGDNRDSPVGDVLVVNPPQVKRFVLGIIANTSNTSAYAEAKAAAPKDVTLQVVNAGNTDGAAHTAVTTLTKAGFNASVDAAQPKQQDTTTIEYPQGKESWAKSLAAYVPGAQVQQASVSTVTLVLGTDGLIAKSTPKATSSGSSGSSKKTHKAIDSGCIN